MKLHYILFLFLSGNFALQAMTKKYDAERLQQLFVISKTEKDLTLIPKTGIGCHIYISKKEDGKLVGNYQERKNTAAIAEFSKFFALSSDESKILWDLIPVNKSNDSK
jgi:lauroyl/myristoyl acyltransferase